MVIAIANWSILQYFIRIIFRSYCNWLFTFYWEIMNTDIDYKKCPSEIKYYDIITVKCTGFTMNFNYNKSNFFSLCGNAVNLTTLFYSEAITFITYQNLTHSMLIQGIIIIFLNVSFFLLFQFATTDKNTNNLLITMELMAFLQHYVL